MNDARSGAIDIFINTAFTPRSFNIAAAGGGGGTSEQNRTAAGAATAAVKTWIQISYGRGMAD